MKRVYMNVNVAECCLLVFLPSLSYGMVLVNYILAALAFVARLLLLASPQPLPQKKTLPLCHFLIQRARPESIQSRTSVRLSPDPLFVIVQNICSPCRVYIREGTCTAAELNHLRGGGPFDTGSVVLSTASSDSRYDVPGDLDHV
ncbi:hypothetical protein K437DRAFT_128721 [Tilletiaria anomala UBC 951]|uniref:Uncharacterized protein n=1 Tax=Tilletiaria anomala (strain ATCC 24038 / CBS 436.72 / UBC 951) TaxID=1037660 RepID=A0A066W1H3_TILAU|nr:uncharacterized protein K437DRAFT_128721 [Tilletiaria anomala UBC 951]KDN44904.1 hypothetical protein K437DRAFT_128721 [Tilletiaria anomala UBC 951]